MASNLVMLHIALKEYGSPARIEITKNELISFDKENNYWKEKLQLPNNPFRLTVVKEGLYDVRAEGITGLIRIGNFNFEVIPKFLNEENSNWHAVLWRILLLTNGQIIGDSFISFSNFKENSLLELITQTFINSFIKGSSKGLPLGYKSLSQSGFFLKGSLDYSRVADLYNYSYKIPYTTEELSENTNILHLLYWTALQLIKITNSPKNLQILRDILNTFNGIRIKTLTYSEARKIKLTSQYTQLKPAVDIGLLFLEKSGITSNNGSMQSFGFLWSSNKVYENFIFLVCTKAAREMSLITSKQTYFFGSMINGGTRLETIPDVVFKDRNQKIVAIADSKYKNYHFKPRSSDTYQMLAAAHLLGSNQVSLIYPVSEDKETSTWLIDSNLGGSKIYLTMLPLNLMKLEKEYGFSDLVSEIKKWVEKEFTI